MIEIKNLSKSYKSAEVYNGFNLSLREGEITCILGESGSGKTTLLNCISGLTDYTGEITPTACSYIFQTPCLVPNLTVYGNLKLVCKDGERINEMLERVRLTEKAKSYPNRLSGGQAQRVAIARAFLFGGDVLLMDEPFTSLDLKLKNEMYALFSEIWERDGRTVLMVTHDIDEALCLANRILVLRGGKIIFDAAVQGSPPRKLGGCDELRQELISVLLE